MQEGTPAFVRMAPIARALAEHKAAGLPYLVYVRHPTTGGVLASWGSLGHVTVAEPEALIFEGAPGEDRELVAVEYVVPFAAVPDDQPAPTLFGEAFRKNQAFGLWTLHVWAWKDNPDGTFADWNPRVSCP